MNIFFSFLPINILEDIFLITSLKPPAVTAISFSRCRHLSRWSRHVYFIFSQLLFQKCIVWCILCSKCVQWGLTVYYGFITWIFTRRIWFDTHAGVANFFFISCSLIYTWNAIRHQTCIPLRFLSKQPNGMNFMSCQNIGCPSCGKSPMYQFLVLPLPVQALERASRLREENNSYVQTDSPSASSGGAPAGSIALVNGSSKRGLTSRSCDKSFRTGRWASEESTYVDKLIQCFDAGLLALPHGIKLNDFLCEMLSCRTSRLTKKLKNAKLSTRSYRSLISGGLLNDSNGINLNLLASIQRAQTLFLKTVTPEWVRIELQFNISRMWRTHLANFW